MNISPNVDLAASFERIKKGLERSEIFWNDEQDQPLVVDRLRRAYANLYAVLVVELEYVERGEITPAVEQPDTITTDRGANANATAERESLTNKKPLIWRQF